jgi:DNA-directed RNA polymerase subunit RPC12/RpoP
MKFEALDNSPDVYDVEPAEVLVRFGAGNNKKLSFTLSDRRCNRCNHRLVVKDRNGTLPARAKSDRAEYYYERIYKCVNRTCRTEVVLFNEDRRKFENKQRMLLEVTE